MSTALHRITVHRGATAGIVFLLVAACAGWVLVHNAQGVPGAYGLAVALILGWKLGLSLLPAQTWPGSWQGRTCVVVPFYNEDPALLVRCMQSIELQDRPPTFVVLVDDGSDDSHAAESAARWCATRRGWSLIRQPANAGKREALAVAFEAHEGEVDVWCCVDSDTVLDPAAIAEGVKPFTDTRVMAATGLVLALNPLKSVLARLIDLRYANAFLYERAAYSRLNSVLCVCGSLAFYRAIVITEGLPGFRGQTFLGAPTVAGDDRHLTNLALQRGRVVLARDSIARTAVPEKIGHWVRQQIRWSKSFVRESVWTLTHLPPCRAAWWLTLIELASQVLFTGAMAWALLAHPLSGNAPPWEYVAWVALAAWARSVHVLSVSRPDLPRRAQVAAFLAAPLYGVLHVLILLPLRFYAIGSLTRSGWGTRDVVEVRN